RRLPGQPGYAPDAISLRNGPRVRELASGVPAAEGRPRWARGRHEMATSPSGDRSGTSSLGKVLPAPCWDRGLLRGQLRLGLGEGGGLGHALVHQSGVTRALLAGPLDDAQRREQANERPGRIELEPTRREVRRHTELVVVVLEELAHRQEVD